MPQAHAPQSSGSSTMSPGLPRDACHVRMQHTAKQQSKGKVTSSTVGRQRLVRNAHACKRPTFARLEETGRRRARGAASGISRNLRHSRTSGPTRVDIMCNVFINGRRRPRFDTFSNVAVHCTYVHRRLWAAQEPRFVPEQHRVCNRLACNRHNHAEAAHCLLM